MNRIAPFFVAVALAFAALPASAVDPAPAAALPDWDRLTPAQRELLVAPIRERWNANPADRARMLEHANRWRGLSPEQRRKFRRGVGRFEDMTPEQRAEARAVFQHMRRLDPEQRRALREKLKRMTPAERQAWLKSQAVPAR